MNTCIDKRKDQKGCVFPCQKIHGKTAVLPKTLCWMKCGPWRWLLVYCG